MEDNEMTTELIESQLPLITITSAEDDEPLEDEPLEDNTEELCNQQHSQGKNTENITPKRKMSTDIGSIWRSRSVGSLNSRDLIDVNTSPVLDRRRRSRPETSLGIRQGSLQGLAERRRSAPSLPSSPLGSRESLAPVGHYSSTQSLNGSLEALAQVDVVTKMKRSGSQGALDILKTLTDERSFVIDRLGGQMSRSSGGSASRLLEMEHKIGASDTTGMHPGHRQRSSSIHHLLFADQFGHIPLTPLPKSRSPSPVPSSRSPSPLPPISDQNCTNSGQANPQARSSSPAARPAIPGARSPSPAARSQSPAARSQSPAGVVHSYNKQSVRKLSLLQPDIDETCILSGQQRRHSVADLQSVVALSKKYAEANRQANLHGRNREDEQRLNERRLTVTEATNQNRQQSLTPLRRPKTTGNMMVKTDRCTAGTQLRKHLENMFDRMTTAQKLEVEAERRKIKEMNV